jgi:hypothetical protein
MFEEEVSVVVEMLQIRMMMDCEEEVDNAPSLSFLVWKRDCYGWFIKTITFLLGFGVLLTCVHGPSAHLKLGSSPLNFFFFFLPSV